MMNVWKVEKPKNDVDTIPGYAPGSPERQRLSESLDRLRQSPEEIPLFIDGKPEWSGKVLETRSPADHGLVLARARLADRKSVV